MRINNPRKNICAILTIVITFILILSGCQFASTTNSSQSGSDAYSNYNNQSGMDSSDSGFSMSESSSSNDSESSASASLSSSSSSSSSSRPSPSPTPTPTFIVDNKYMYINVDTANLRTQSNTSSSIITKLHYRSKVKRILILEKWSQVIIDGDETTGFVYSEFLSATIPDITPTIAPPRVMTKWPAQSTLTSTFYSAKLEDYIGRTEFTPLKGITVILDPGHGGLDVGAQYTKGLNPVYEKTINLAVSLKIGSQLTDLGAEVVYTRHDDSELSLYARNAIINRFIMEKHKKILQDKSEDTSEADRIIGLMNQVIQFNYDKPLSGRGIFQGLGVNETIRSVMDISREHEDVLVLSIHSNSILNSDSTHGVEIYYGTNSAIFNDEKILLVNEPASNPLNPAYQYYNDTSRRKLAVALRDSIKKETSLPMRGPDGGVYAWNFCMIRESNLTSALIEMGYISNSSDRMFLTDPAGQNMMALGIAKAVYNYYCTP